MNIESAIESIAAVENAGGAFYLTFPYTSTVGKAEQSLAVRVPIHSERVSDKDKKALAEAVSVQGALGTWELRQDGTAWLVSDASE